LTLSWSLPPLEMNAEVTLAALEAGKDVFCEKPMAVHVDVADRIMEMEKQTGKRCMFWSNSCIIPSCR